MRSEIELFINLAYNQEKVELFKKCFSVFEEFSLEDYDLNMLELISMYDSLDSTQAFLEFEIIVKNTLISVIQEHGIVLDDEADLSIVCEIARCLNAIQSYDDKESILRTLESDYDSEEKLCQLFRFVSNESADNFMIAINEVDQNIFTKINEIYQNVEMEELTQEEINATNTIVKQLKELKAFLKFDDAIGFKLLSRGLLVNGDFHLYIKYCVQKFETMELVQIAKELLVILFMSKQSYSSPIMFFRSVSNQLFDDIDKITKVDVALNTLINDFNREKAQQMKNINPAIEQIEEAVENKVEPNDADVPPGDYLGSVTGYVAEFFYNDISYKIKMDWGVRGTDLPCRITKAEDGSYKVEPD